jgi:transposase InsO family protein
LRATINAAIIALPRHRILVLIVARLSSSLSRYTRNSIGRYLDFYNRRRPHSSLDGGTPDQAYFTPLPLRPAA